MLKVTMENVTKMSEDALYLELERLPEDSDMHPIIEAELDRRLEVQERNLKARQEDELNSMKLTQEIQIEMIHIFGDYKGKRTLFLIQRLGQEFMDEYSIDESTFTVYSKAQQCFPNQPSSWECETIEQARSKMAGLLYDRIYHRYMRDATSENLAFIKKALI